MLTRRTFIGWLGTIGSAIGLGARDRATPNAGRIEDLQGAALDSQRITSLGEAILPTELGDLGADRVARAFVQWAGNYREGVELVHPYGSAGIRHTGESPVRRWRAQLDELDRTARAAHRRTFTALTTDQRRAVVAESLASESGRLPDPVRAGHVAVALLSWFYGTPEATNLCYRARIDANQCRPLVQTSREPLPLAGGGRDTGEREPASGRKP